MNTDDAWTRYMEEAERIEAALSKIRAGLDSERWSGRLPSEINWGDCGMLTHFRQQLETVAGQIAGELPL